MRRRGVLAGLSTAIGAGTTGCLGSVPGLGSSGPKYEREQRPEMLLTEDDFPEGWERLPDDYNQNFAVGFARGGDVVLLDVTVFDTVSKAKDGLDAVEAGVADPNEYTIADESIWYKRPDNARTLFRDSNAVGTSVAVRTSNDRAVPDPVRSQTYARRMYQRWTSL